MNEIELSIREYNQLKKDLLNIVKELDMCAGEKKNMYQDIALCYTLHLNDMKKIMKDKFNLKV
ncbi:hypothetical protein ACQJ0K_28570 [Priestia megaterium]|uniref:hypothetical protein n=1 Tax=Priestia megaterium TaxID=1404 RepID=UPI003CF43388